MNSIARFAGSPTAAVPRPALSRGPNRGLRCGVLRAVMNDGIDPLFDSAIAAASLRFQETNRPEPLLLDPYAGCFVTPDFDMNPKKHTPHYTLSTRFIDDKLLSTVSHIDNFKQVVLLTDGMDTRPYRLKWPYLTIIFDISPDRVFKGSSDKLKVAGAKVPGTCVFIHIPSQTSKLQEALMAKGFNGNHPSIWAMQGYPIMTLANFEEILGLVSSMAKQGSYFVGEMPSWLAETEVGKKPDLNIWMDKLFRSKGFKVKIINHAEIAKNYRKQPGSGGYGNILFIAEQLMLSEDQMDTWRKASKRIEEDGDEEGFEEI